MKNLKLRAIAVSVFLTVIALVLQTSLVSLRAARAQEDSSGLSPEKQALVERVNRSLQHQKSYTSYVEHVTFQRTLTISILSVVVGITEQNQEEDTTIDQTSTTSVEIDRLSYIVQDDDALNILSNVNVETLVISTAPPEYNRTFNYTLGAEVRLVDGNIYVMAEYQTDATEDVGLPQLSPEWILITDEVLESGETWDDILWELELNYYRGAGKPFQDDEKLTSLVQDVTVESGTLEDGTAVDIITLTLQGEGMPDFVSEALSIERANPYFDAFFNPGTTMVYAFSLDENDTLRLINASLQTKGDVNLSTLAPGTPPGVLAFAEAVFNQQIEYRDINVPLEPVTDPTLVLQ